MNDRDKRIGAAITTLRGERSQQSVADAMRERGWKWSQATVWSVEKGERPLRLVEAEDLASVLSTFVGMFTATPVEVQLHAAMGQLKSRFDGIARLTGEFLQWQEQIRAGLESATKEGVQLRPAVELAGGWLEGGPEEAVAFGRMVRERESDVDVAIQDWRPGAQQEGTDNG